MSFVSYAQNFEDVLLNRVFGGQGTGFYVDVGAYHPVIGSVTKALYDRGWSGINIEPGTVYDELAAARPRDVNLRMAVLDRTGTVLFKENALDRGMSRVVSGTDDEGTAEIVCDTLENILRVHGDGRPVDLLKVDAEGAEGAIVASTNWRVCRPRVLLFEATLPWSNVLSNDLWEPALIEQGYIRCYFDGINCFYLPEEEVITLGRHFKVPVNQLDRPVRNDEIVLREVGNNQRDEIARLTAERSEQSKILEGLVAERNAQVEQSAVRDKEHLQDFTRLSAEKEVLVASQNLLSEEMVAIRNSLDEASAQRDDLEAFYAALESERNSLVRAVSELEGRLASRSPSQEAVMSETRSRPTRWKLFRALARAGYFVVRPVVKPVAWRVRGFLLDRLHAELRGVINSQEANTSRIIGNQDVLERLERTFRDAALAGKGLISTHRNSDSLDGAGAQEIRRLAQEMEHHLISLALESAQAPKSHPAPHSAWMAVPLLLSGGRRIEIDCPENDLSVGSALMASNGEWEPHIRRFFEGHVRPDWTCIDIGANVGAHALSLAALACDGRVVAFEADPSNYVLLVRNCLQLDGKKAVIDPVHVALWDGIGRLTIGGAEELAGCSFVAEGAPREEDLERSLRSVVSSDAIGHARITMKTADILALPLDDWVKSHPIARLDLIKMDVEGAEVNVLRGAVQTLRQYRPMMIVEYNPACAATYFNQAPEALFRELQLHFDTIKILEPTGILTAVQNWETLRARLQTGKGWEDLLCVHEDGPTNSLSA